MRLNQTSSSSKHRAAQQALAPDTAPLRFAAWVKREPLARSLCEEANLMNYTYQMDSRPFDIWTEALMTTDFRQYLETMEGFIERWRQERLKDVDNLPDEVSFDLCMEVEGFEQILRQSYFVALCAYLEARLVRECRHRRKSQGEPLFALRHRVLQEAMKYLVERGIKDLRQNGEWNEITEYWRLRNCIVHSIGELTDQFSDREALRAYIDRTPSLSLSSFDEVILSKRFCQETTDTIDRFLYSVLEACRDLPFFGLGGEPSHSERNVG